jgi:3-deoxy-manno-octulosonate cytidylyltransferase (CMP-KDO synthetase)
MNIIGIVPARMGANRFPGKPLHPIAGRPLVEHCFLRGRMFDRWDGYFLATCDDELRAFAEEKDFPCIMTADTHTRALDRVAEATEKCGMDVANDDIVVCVQGDEPLMVPEMIEAVVAPFETDSDVRGTMLAVPITDESLYHNPDIVKIVHDIAGDVLYTSRSPIPYAKAFSPELGAKRVGGIFGFRWEFLKWFTSQPESPLEQAEACDSNRICDNGYRQRMALIQPRAYYSVDSPEDVKLVETALKTDPLWGTY